MPALTHTHTHLHPTWNHQSSLDGGLTDWMSRCHGSLYRESKNKTKNAQPLRRWCYDSILKTFKNRLATNIKRNFRKFSQHPNSAKFTNRNELMNGSRRLAGMEEGPPASQNCWLGGWKLWKWMEKIISFGYFSALFIDTFSEDVVMDMANVSVCVAASLLKMCHDWHRDGSSLAENRIRNGTTRCLDENTSTDDNIHDKMDSQIDWLMEERIILREGGGREKGNGGKCPHK